MRSNNSHIPEIIVFNNDMTDEQIKGLLIQCDAPNESPSMSMSVS